MSRAQLLPVKKNAHFGPALLVALVADGLNWLMPVVDVPGIGTLYDLFVTAILYKLIGPIALLSLEELIPVVDLAPGYTITVLVGWLLKK